VKETEGDENGDEEEIYQTALECLDLDNPKEEFYITDLSTNGTYLNRQRL
jgi:hypothetical protein